MPSITTPTERARDILRINDRGGYTVPTASLYPFQWNWDSAFVAMGFATYDVDRAFRELERLIEGQWADGLIPHIVFHTPSDTYFPGPDVWRTAAQSPPGGPPTSGISQPPVFGMALKCVYDAAVRARGPDYTERTRRLFDAAVLHHRWWLRARDPDGTGLVAVLHNWETGSDNSPAWDDALARVPTTTTTKIVRKDTGHVDAAMRPRDIDYLRYIHLVDTYADCAWDAQRLWQSAPFKIAEVQMTAILARATEDLIALAPALGASDVVPELRAMHSVLTRGLLRQWRPALGRFVSRDLATSMDIDTPTQAGFVPLLALTLDTAQRDAVVRELTTWLDACVVGVPSVPPGEAGFEVKRYWRGPVWAVINWLIIDGLQRNGCDALAARIREETVTAIERAGFAESFNPLTGEPCGGLSFSWTAATYLHFTQTG
jgi:glycogen debranching enzyme